MEVDVLVREEEWLVSDVAGSLLVCCAVVRPTGVSLFLRNVLDVVSFLAFIEFFIGVLHVEPEGLELFSLVVFKFGTRLFDEVGEESTLIFDSNGAFRVELRVCIAVRFGFSCGFESKFSFNLSILCLNSCVSSSTRSISFFFSDIKSILKLVLEVVVVDVRDRFVNLIVKVCHQGLLVFESTVNGVESPRAFSIKLC